MHLEVQVALNFVISYLYNKLPRRRVNIFGEELEKALKEKFRGHWYPDKPVKGSAFRCLKTGDPIDQVFEKAARESGVPIQDILENLPQELAVWVDPGEVSYRIGEKGTIKILYSEAAAAAAVAAADAHEEASAAADREVIKTFNPEAQCFRPIEAVLGALNLSPKASPPLPQSEVSPTAANASAPFTKGPPGSPSPVPPPPSTAFLPRSTAPLTFTTATFAQTKFGSTKLKTNSKRANRMSPTEFSNYIKQRAMQQQANGGGCHGGGGPGSSPGRSLSPSVNPPDLFFQSYYRPTLFDSYHAGGGGGSDLYSKLPPYLEQSQYYPMAANGSPQSVNGGSGTGSNGSVQPSSSSPSSSSSLSSSSSSSSQPSQDAKQQLLDSLNNFPTYSPNQYQHLLVAN